MLIQDIKPRNAHLKRAKPKLRIHGRTITIVSA